MNKPTRVVIRWKEDRIERFIASLGFGKEMRFDVYTTRQIAAARRRLRRSGTTIRCIMNPETNKMFVWMGRRR
jgi:hypothetical protein